MRKEALVSRSRERGPRGEVSGYFSGREGDGVNFSGRSLHLGIHGTWRTGGADAGEGAAGSVSRRKEPV